MRVFFSLESFCLLTLCWTLGAAGLTLPPNQAIDSPGSLTMQSLNTTNPPAVELCTSSLIWTGGTGYDYELTDDCFQAWQTFLHTDLATHMSAEFEFAQQGLAPAHPGIPYMATPRRYIKSESTEHLVDNFMSLITRRPGSCTIAIANIADIPRGILPNQSPGPFPRSDLGRFADFRLPISTVRANCLGRRKMLGWAAVGK